jgi:hypothetical protein
MIPQVKGVYMCFLKQLMSMERYEDGIVLRFRTGATVPLSYHWSAGSPGAFIARYCI